MERKSTMGYLQNGIEPLDQLASLLSMAVPFLIGSIAGWYMGDLIHCFRR